MVTITHNIDPTKFGVLWAKYVRGCNLNNHCAGCVLGSWSKKFSKCWNPKLGEQYVIEMDEQPDGNYRALYLCGVSNKEGTQAKKNYPHNLHLPIVPEEGRKDAIDFEEWHIEIDGGYIDRIPEEKELAPIFFKEPYNALYYTCRIFRWAVGFFHPELLTDPRQEGE